MTSKVKYTHNTSGAGASTAPCGRSRSSIQDDDDGKYNYLLASLVDDIVLASESEAEIESEEYESDWSDEVDGKSINR